MPDLIALDIQQDGPFLRAWLVLAGTPHRIEIGSLRVSAVEGLEEGDWRLLMGEIAARWNAQGPEAVTRTVLQRLAP